MPREKERHKTQGSCVYDNSSLPGAAHGRPVMTGSRIVQAGLGLAVTSLFIWLIIRQVDGADIWAALATAKTGWIGLGVLMFFCGYAARVRRWQLMLRHKDPAMTWVRAFLPFLGSIAVNNLVPFRAGDALRALGFTKWLNQSAPNVLATLLVERMLDLLTLLLALGLALLWFGFAINTAGNLFGVGAGGLIALGLVVLAVLLKPRLMAPVAFGLVHLVGVVSGRLGARARSAVERVFETLAELASGAGMITLVLWSLIAWSFEALVFYYVALGVPALGDAVAAFLALPVGTLSTLLPSTPGYVGTFDYFVIQAMQMMGNAPAAAAAFAVLVHLVLWLPATLTGVASLIYLQSRGAFSRHKPDAVA